MSVATSTALLIGGGLAAGGSIGSALLGKSAASSAATQQEKAAQAAIDEQKRQFDTTQANYAPWLTAGTGALSQLTSGTAPGGSLVAPYSGGPFAAPTLDNTNDPGYAFRLQQGEQALLRAQNASGGASTGGTLAALTRYGQDYASNEYSNVYNRALQGYDTNFNVYNTGQTNAYNRLAALAGMGQNATNALGTLGAQNASSIAGLLTDQGTAASAGTLGGASALGSGLTGALSSLSNGLVGGSIINLLTGSSGTPHIVPGMPGYDPSFH